VCHPSGRYDEAIERDTALLNLCGTLHANARSGEPARARVSRCLLRRFPTQWPSFYQRRQEVLGATSGNASMDRSLHRRNRYFSVRRTTVEKEPTLVVPGVDDGGHKSVLAMVQGDRDSKGCVEGGFRATQGARTGCQRGATRDHGWRCRAWQERSVRRFRMHAYNDAGCTRDGTYFRWFRSAIRAVSRRRGMVCNTPGAKRLQALHSRP
jgi:hypothetical protein